MKKVKQSRSQKQNSLSQLPVKTKLKDADLNQVSGGDFRWKHLNISAL